MEIVIQHKPDGFYLHRKHIDQKLIEGLIAAINEPVLAKPELHNLGITQDWLDANAERAGMDYDPRRFREASQNQKALFTSTFKNPTVISNVLSSIFFGSVKVDDYPFIKVLITERTGKTTSVSSNGQFLLMLPWKNEEIGQSVETYNANISYAIASLLPENFLNKRRLASDEIPRTLAEYVMVQILRDWKLLDQQNKVLRTESK
jgi:hypothetical protein